TGVAPNGIELHPIIDIDFTAPTTTTLASNANPSQFGGAVTITAAVSNGGATTPTGNVTFSDGGHPLATRALDNTGPTAYTASGQAAANVAVTGYTGVYDGHAHGAIGSALGINGEDLSALLAFGSSFTDVPGGIAHWTFAGNANYAPAAGDVSITITQATATV